MTDEVTRGIGQTGGSPERPPRELEPTLRAFDIDELLEQLVADGDDGAGRRAIALLHRPDLRVVLTQVDAGTTVGDRSSDQDVLMVALSGDGTVTAADTSEGLDADRLVTVAAGIDWSLTAREELIALLVFGGREGSDRREGSGREAAR